MTLVEELLVELESNPSKDLPYHNNAHMIKVCDIAIEIYMAEQDNCTDIGIPTEWIHPALVVAALLHDYGHSGGHQTDNVNVTVARRQAVSFLDRLDFTVPEEVYEVIDSAIRCTEYPFTIEPRNHLEKILRDADLLYTAVVGKVKIVMEDLRSEIKVSQNRDISLREMHVGQRIFLDSAVLYTDTGQCKWDLLAPPFYDKMVKYVLKASLNSKPTAHPNNLWTKLCYGAGLVIFGIVIYSMFFMNKTDNTNVGVEVTRSEFVSNCIITTLNEEYRLRPKLTPEYPSIVLGCTADGFVLYPTTNL